MCIGENDNAKFIRRRDAAIKYMKELLDVEGMIGPEAIQITTDKFRLNASIRDDYRIYMTLWNLVGD